MVSKELLEKRNEIKKNKPSFRRQDSHKRPRLSESWRKPRGIDSKIRLKLKSYLKSPSVGYGSPKEVKGLTKQGLIPIIVNNIRDLETINPKKEVAVIGGTVGAKKKLELVKLLSEKKIMIFNVKDSKEYIKSVEENLVDRKKKKDEIQKKKDKKKKDKEKEEKEKQKEKKKENLSDKIEKESELQEDQKEKEKKQKDEIITKKE
jgi:large subunit ribosomal protein L32e